MFDQEKEFLDKEKGKTECGATQGGRSPTGDTPHSGQNQQHYPPGEFEDIAARLTAAWRPSRPEGKFSITFEKDKAKPQETASVSPQAVLQPDFISKTPHPIEEPPFPDDEELPGDEEEYHSPFNRHINIAGSAGGGMPDLSSPLEEDARRIRRKVSRSKSRSLSKSVPRTVYKPEQRILLIDTWRRSGLPCKDFAALVGVGSHTLYKWNSLFEKYGPAGLMDKPKGSQKGSRLPEITRRMILMIKDSNPEAGCEMISDMLARSPGVPASATAVAKVLKEAGYEYDEVPTSPHPDKKRRFERAKPNQMWQTDIFTFTLKRQNRRVHLVAFMDDHSRFITGYCLRGVASGDMVMEALRAAVVAFGCPDELLTDNGPQYIAWRGKSKFSKLCESMGINQIVSRPRHPQTLGKIERFWRTLWEGFLKTAVFLDMEDARRRIGLFIDYYNFKRPHRSLENALVPADRFFGVAPEVMNSMKQRLQENALEIARKGFPKQPFYLSGQVDGLPFSLHEENGRVYMIRQDGEREEVELVTPFGLDSVEKAQAMEGSGFSENIRKLADELEEQQYAEDDYERI